MTQPDGEPVLQISGLTHYYRRGTPVLEGVDLAVGPGERVALIGRSGAGKSTLLRCVNGLVVPRGGSIVLYKDQRLAMLGEGGRRRVRRTIGMIFQEFNLVDRLSVLKNVLVGRLGYVGSLASCFHIFSASDVSLANQAIAQVGLAGYERVRVRELSGGQKQRVAIARTMAQGARIILGDEATANLDLTTTEEIMQILVDLADQRDVALLLSMHNLEVARRYCRRVVGLRRGRIVFDGHPDELDDALAREILSV